LPRSRYSCFGAGAGRRSSDFAISAANAHRLDAIGVELSRCRAVRARRA
jgi:hypothetical protein